MRAIFRALLIVVAIVLFNAPGFAATGDDIWSDARHFVKRLNCTYLQQFDSCIEVDLNLPVAKWKKRNIVSFDQFIDFGREKLFLTPLQRFTQWRFRLHAASCEQEKYAPSCRKAAGFFDRPTAYAGLAAARQKAQKFYALACELGDRTACSLSSLTYGLPPEQPISTVNEMRQKCLRLRHQACMDLGAKYRDGVGVSKNPFRSAKLFKRACLADVWKGCEALARQYLLGTGVRYDVDEALKYRVLACSAGGSNHCSFFANAYAEGNNVPKDRAKAAIFLGRACELGNAEMCVEAGIAHAFGGVVEQELAVARSFFDRGCQAGILAACMYSGFAEDTDERISKIGATELKQQSDLCSGGDIKACTFAGYALMINQGAVLDETKALGFLKKSCEADDFSACYGFALRMASYENFELAQPSITKSCHGGLKKACWALGDNQILHQ